MNKHSKLPVAVFLLFLANASQLANAQVRQAPNQSLIARGKYIVEGVAMCERCHTPRDENGTPDRSHWLEGGPVQTQSTYPVQNWATREPRIAGKPPGTDEEFITLMTTGISRTHRPPNPPMPSFRMTREDAEAVLAYLKSLR